MSEEEIAAYQERKGRTKRLGRHQARSLMREAGVWVRYRVSAQ